MAIIGSKGLRTRGAYNVGIRLEGQWKEVNDLVNSLDTIISTAAIAGQKAFALKYKKEVKKNIRTNGGKFRYPPLSAKYLAFKTKHGGPSGPLIWSKGMYDAVDIHNFGKGRVGVGIEQGLRRENYEGESEKGNQLTISEYANILEHGHYPMPARPVFKDTFNSLGGKNGIRETIELSLITRFKSRNIPITRI